MIYKIGKVSDLAKIPIEDYAKGYLYYYANLLSTEYGENRNVDLDVGGYILYATSGTTVKEIKACFDTTQNTAEYVDSNGVFCSAVYITGNDYGVAVVAPCDTMKEINNKGDKI